MHELAVIAHKIDEMKVNIAWITECFCSGVIVVNEFKVDNKLDDFNHELLEVLRTRTACGFTNTNRANDTLEPTAL